MMHIKPLAHGLACSRHSMHLAIMIFIVNYDKGLRVCLLGAYRRVKATKGRIKMTGCCSLFSRWRVGIYLEG